MTLTFWELYLPALAILLGLGIIAGILEARVRSAFRRWRCQREMARVERERRECEQCGTVVSPHPHHTIQWTSTPDETLILSGGKGYHFSRRELDGLATARDKAERKIH